MAHVFISHSAKDKAAADAVCASLERQGIHCWMAPRNILPGKDWGAAIIEAITKARVMVLIFSSHSNGSKQVAREVERAASKDVAIVPFRIQDVKPTESMEYFLSNTQWLDALTPPLEEHADVLAKNLQSLFERDDGPQDATARAPAAIPAPTERPSPARTEAPAAGPAIARPVPEPAAPPIAALKQPQAPQSPRPLKDAPSVQATPAPLLSRPGQTVGVQTASNGPRTEPAPADAPTKAREEKPQGTPRTAPIRTALLCCGLLAAVVVWQLGRPPLPTPAPDPPPAYEAAQAPPPEPAAEPPAQEETADETPAAAPPEPKRGKAGKAKARRTPSEEEPAEEGGDASQESTPSPEETHLPGPGASGALSDLVRHGLLQVDDDGKGLGLILDRCMRWRKDLNDRPEAFSKTVEDARAVLKPNYKVTYPYKYGELGDHLVTYAEDLRKAGDTGGADEMLTLARESYTTCAKRTKGLFAKDKWRHDDCSRKVESLKQGKTPKDKDWPGSVEDEMKRLGLY